MKDELNEGGIRLYSSLIPAFILHPLFVTSMWLYSSNTSVDNSPSSFWIFRRSSQSLSSFECANQLPVGFCLKSTMVPVTVSLQAFSRSRWPNCWVTLTRAPGTRDLRIESSMGAVYRHKG